MSKIRIGITKKINQSSKTLFIIFYIWINYLKALPCLLKLVSIEQILLKIKLIMLPSMSKTSVLFFTSISFTALLQFHKHMID
jgi:hypothetical protein